MAGMARTALVAAIFTLVMLPSGALAAGICDSPSATIPHYPSLNSSMLLIIPASDVSYWFGGLSPPMKVRWDVHDEWFTPIPWAAGSMAKFGSCYVCEFSGSPSFDASCGPTPFTTEYGNEYNITFIANDFNEEKTFDRSILMHPDQFRGILIDIGEDGKVQATADPPAVPMADVSMDIYDASTGLRSNASGSMEEGDYGRYTKDIEGLKPGVYYADFSFRTSEGKAGGDLRKFTISPVSGFTVEPEKASYWIGEKMQITGISGYPKVKLSLLLNDNTVATQEKAVADGRYDAEFQLEKTYLKGNYTVAAEYGTNKVEKPVEVKELFTLSKVTHTFTFFDSSSKLSENVTVRNAVNDSINLTVSTDLGSFLVPSLAKSGLGPFTTTTLTLAANPTGLPSAGKSGKVTVLTSDGKVAISMDVSLVSNAACPQCPAASSPAIEVSPSLWEKKKCVAGDTIEETFTITNRGAGALGGFSLSSADFNVNEEKTSLPSGSIAAGGTGNAVVSLVAEDGLKSGYLELSSGSSRARIYVVTSCAYDNTIDVETLRGNFDALYVSFTESGFSDDKVDALMGDVEYDLGNAESYAASGDFAAAAQSYAKASAGYDALESAYDEIGSGGSGDGGLLVMMLSVALVAVLGILFYVMFGAKLLKGKAAGGGEERSGQQAEEELF